jgi:hypothetical protein
LPHTTTLVLANLTPEVGAAQDFCAPGTWVSPREDLGRFDVRRSMVGVAGFEPAAPCSQSRCATGLRHTPTLEPTFYT